MVCALFYILLGVSHIHTAHKIGGRILGVHCRTVYQDATEFLFVACISLIHKSRETDRVVIIGEISGLGRQDRRNLSPVVRIGFAYQPDSVTFNSISVVSSTHSKVEIIAG